MSLSDVHPQFRVARPPEKWCALPVSILSSALPGFRDLRAPLTAGYLWLLFLYLDFQPSLDRPREDGPWLALYVLAERSGRVGVVLALSVAAYLVGSVSQGASGLLMSRRMRARFWPSYRRYARARGYARSALLPRRAHHRALLLAQHEAEQKISQWPIDSVTVRRLNALVEHEASRAAVGIEHEVGLTAPLLVGDNDNLFAEVDRLRAEADLRTAVTLPLLALAIWGSVEVSGVAALSALPVAVLAVQGVRREQEARTVVGEAIAAGRITSPSLASFRDWVNALEPSRQTLPD